MKISNVLLGMLSMVLILSCSSDDDGSNGNNPSTRDLLTADTWYQESFTPGNFSACEKNTSFKFNTDNTIMVESYDDGSGTCESQGIVESTYTLNDLTITLILGGDTIVATINSISETMLSVTDDEGSTIIFDKTQG